MSGPHERGGNSLLDEEQDVVPVPRLGGKACQEEALPEEIRWGPKK